MTCISVGLHVCIGRELAKLEARVTLTALRKRYPKLRLVMKVSALVLSCSGGKPSYRYRTSRLTEVSVD